MKNPLIVVITILLFVNLAIGQSKKAEDFIELGFSSSRFIKSSFLQNSSYQSQLSNPDIETAGIVPSLTGVNYGAKLRYGKGLSSKTYLIGELGITNRNEQVLAFCHHCDLAAKPFTLVVINSIDIGLGIRQRLFSSGRFDLSIEGIGSYSVSTNEPGLTFFGYYIYPVIQYHLNEYLGMNLRYGFGQSFTSYQKMERYFEVGVNYAIGK